MTSLANSSNTTDHCVHRKTPVSIKFIHLGMLVTLLLCENVAALVVPSTNYNTISRHPYYRRTTRLPSTLFYRDETDPMEAKELSANMTPKKEKPSDFQSRMKRIIVQQRPTTSQQRQKSGSSYRPDNIQTVVSLDEFSKVIDEGRRENKLIVVRFFATWCKVSSCEGCRILFTVLHFLFSIVLIIFKFLCILFPIFRRVIPFGRHLTR